MPRRARRSVWHIRWRQWPADDVTERVVTMVSTPHAPAEPPAVSEPAPQEASEPAAPSAPAISRYLRGSALLLVGRFISVLLNFAVQVLVVRYFAKSDYGAFAFAIGIVSFGTSTILLGMGKSIPRLVAVYHEHKDYSRTFGSIALAVTVVWTLGLLLVLLLHGFKDVIGERAVSDPKTLSVLLVLIALAPVDAFDHLLQQLSAIFSGPRAIFIRRQVLGPAMKLATVLAVIYTKGDVYMLAYGYLLGSLVGVSLYVVGLLRAWHRQGLLSYLRVSRLVLPVRELASSSLPLLSSDMAIILRGSAALILLEYFHTPADVAEYRAVLPVAGLNMLVFEAFGFLFVPLASRMFARGDRAGVSDLYWQTSLWIAVLTFPIFAVTCALARPLTVWLFGEEYAGAATLLSILAAGYYFNAALGFNAASLRVHGRFKTIVINDMVAGITGVVMSVVLIRSYGSLGAALSTMGTLVLQNILNHVGLWTNTTAIRLFAWEFVRSYVLIAAAIAVLLASERRLAPPLYVGLGSVAICSVLLIRFTRRALDVEGRFPELLRVPLMRQLFT
jgi:O-antigen/teichoic acid export membrane protein